MHLSRLSLTDFRSYADAVLSPGPGLVVLTGENGAGKTNILEAVSLLTPGRGLRGASLSEMARQKGAGGFSVAARLSSPLPFKGGDQGVGASLAEASPTMSTSPTPSPSPDGKGGVEIGTGTLATAPERRQVRINGATASAAALGEWLSVLWLTPAMDRLFTEGASGRRRFFDRLVLALEPSHATHAARYEAAMRARNKLLAEPETADPAWLGALEAGMAEHGARIAEARERALAWLGERLAAQAEGPFARAGLALGGWRPADDAEGALRAELKAGRGRDAAAGRTLAGPHRTDLLVTHLAKGQAAEACSTGEQKALLLAIVLAHADLVADHADRRPILLLDEVTAHLDPSRRAALFDRLESAGGQVWMTGTERALFDSVGAGATWLTVENGAIRES
ncbi:DNA replication/repair protein RecF [Allosphingosinicella flava]|uniref:DNA replication and repair protein RecF n=1 Tax=Allosphingosinicella flava TaxID=2771430 RepID=A0A7T2GIR3_9SPHN|nr:DNA replication/repair protein RecF [Sphingosinicella flava]QPQ54612.1 DNA replication/repair protein RecF [Sphingosinicella flava]